MGRDKNFHISIFFVLIFTLIACQNDEENTGSLTTGDDDTNTIATLGEIASLPQAVRHPGDNEYSIGKVELGRNLFWDPILSGTKEIACVSCHHPSLGYADGRDLALGVNGQGLGPNRNFGNLINRNSPTIINTGYNGINTNGNYNPSTAPMFWDNRASGLEEQALLPILSSDEMRGNEIAEGDIVDTIIQRLNAISEYQDLFDNAFGSRTVTSERITQAIATFQRSIIANNSRFDQYMRGNLDALNNAEIEGMNTFMDVGCTDCHSGPMFSDYELHTLSVPDDPRITDNGANGRFDFRTPTLRNLGLTAPYMHNGTFDDLNDVLDFYDDISGNNPNSQNPNVRDNQIDQDARNLRLNRREINEIITFLNTLNDNNFDRTILTDVPSGLVSGGNIN